MERTNRNNRNDGTTTRIMGHGHEQSPPLPQQQHQHQDGSGGRNAAPFDERNTTSSPSTSSSHHRRTAGWLQYQQEKKGQQQQQPQTATAVLVPPSSLVLGRTTNIESPTTNPKTGGVAASQSQPSSTINSTMMSHGSTITERTREREEEVAEDEDDLQTPYTGAYMTALELEPTPPIQFPTLSAIAAADAGHPSSAGRVIATGTGDIYHKDHSSSSRRSRSPSPSAMRRPHLHPDGTTTTAGHNNEGGSIVSKLTVTIIWTLMTIWNFCTGRSDHTRNTSTGQHHRGSGGMLSYSSFVPSQFVFVQACYLSLAAMAATLLRLVLAQVFGQACSNPGTVGYIKDEAVLCVTSSGETTQNDGIIFADLPANLLGCFIMGLLQDGTNLGLAIPVPLALVAPWHTFQAYSVFHLALRTGFCGSLTTFSAWNSEMVLLLVGNHDNVIPNRHSMLWRALFGYIIGIETAIGSYVFGRTVAVWWHRYWNPALAAEQDELNLRQHKHGMVVNRNLPILERRYLHRLFEHQAITTNTGDGEDIGTSNTNSSSLLSPPSMRDTMVPPSAVLTTEELEPLCRWRESTTLSRRVESGVSITTQLVKLETALMIRKEQITHEHIAWSQEHDWDLPALQDWLSKRNYYTDDTTDDAINPTTTTNVNTSMLSLSSTPGSAGPSQGKTTPAGIAQAFDVEETVWYQTPVALLLVVLSVLILLLCMLHWIEHTSYHITYRTMAYSMLFAPPGALLRWKLSGWNAPLGSTSTGSTAIYYWLPVGTLLANVVGSMLSITMIGWEYNINMVQLASSSSASSVSNFWLIATIRAVKIGFCGCLTTVSTFIAEVHKFTTQQGQFDRGYKYIVLTLFFSATLSMIVFVILV